MTTHDPMRERIEACNHARGGGVRVNKAGRGYTLVSGRTGLPLRLTDGRTVLVPTRDPAALRAALVGARGTLGS